MSIESAEPAVLVRRDCRAGLRLVSTSLASSGLDMMLPFSQIRCNRASMLSFSLCSASKPQVELVTLGLSGFRRYTFLVKEDPLDLRKAKAILEASCSSSFESPAAGDADRGAGNPRGDHSPKL